MGNGKVFLVCIGAWLIRTTIKDISEAIKWKAYYAASGRKPLPPGYVVRPVGEGFDKITIAEKRPKMPKTDAAIKSMINDTFNTAECKNEALEGQIEASCVQETPPETEECDSE